MIKNELETVSQSHSPSVQMKGDDKQIHFYTGLPSYIAFTNLLSSSSSVILSSEQHGGITLSDQLLVVLMKLRQAMTNQDLGYRFHIHLTRVSKIFHLWIDAMVTQLSPLVKWPDRGMIRSTVVLYQTLLSHCTHVPSALLIALKILYNGQLLYQQELRLIPTINITILLNFNCY